MPKINAAGLALIEQFEGCFLTAYQDANGIWTIGYGHTGPDVHMGLVISQATAQQLLEADVASAEAAVADAVEVTLTPNQFSALVSFVYNVGASAFEGSTMLALINEGQFGDAALQFGRWVDDPPLPGLVARRSAEKALWLTPG